MRIPRMTLGVLAVVAAVGALWIPSAAADDARAVHYYVSLGDSLAAGYQPTLGRANGGDRGYADQLYAIEKAADPSLRLVKMGCSGESTVSMINAFPGATNERAGCRFPQGSQLAKAVSFLHAHRPFVSFVTIDIGANDVLSGGGVPAIVQNLPIILGALRQAAGPDVPIIGMNYYAVFLPVVWAQTQSVAAVQAEAANTVAFNNVLETIYGAFGDPVADVESAFSTTDTTLVGGVPLNVVRICQWTWMCAPPPFGPDIHANDAGYGVIAEAFHEVLHP